MVHQRSVDSGLTFCSEPTLLIVVLTCCRPESLSRLLDSANSAEYGCAKIDLVIEVDWVEDRKGHRPNETLRIAEELDWHAGSKYARKRVAKAGLANSWFEIFYSSPQEYVLILEDDMEVSPNFYKFLSLLHDHSSLDSATALCLHPGDWGIRVKGQCDIPAISSSLYLTPEPCSWAPVWKQEEWRLFLVWLQEMKSNRELPLVSQKNNISYNYNAYIERGSDVQSSWIWMYNWEHAKRQLRYRYKTCNVLLREPFFAVNHKEPGTHFKKKANFLADSALLNFDFNLVLDAHSNIDSFNPAPFYEKLLLPRN